MRNFRSLSILLALLLPAQLLTGQIMQSQVYTYFMKAERYHQQGKDSLAIASLDEMAELVPAFPLTYLRQGNIYYDMYQKDGSKEALSGAVFMYRKYLTLEFKEELIKEPSERLHALENIMQVAHFEDAEKNDSQYELKDDIKAITDDESAKMIASSETKNQNTEIIDLVPLVHTQDAEPGTSAEAYLKPRNSALIPQIGQPKFSYLSLYDITLPKSPVLNDQRVSSISGQELIGHWVTETIIGNGRELWSFDIKEEGLGEYYVYFNNQSGIVHPAVDESTVFRRSLLFVKKYLQKSKLLSDKKYEVLVERAKAKVEPAGLTFTFVVEEEHIPGTTLRKWSKNLVNNIHSILPFGTAINNYVNNIVDQKEKADNTKNSSISYTFTCRPKSENILDCTISTISNSQTENGKLKTKIGKTTSCSLLKTESDYVIGHLEGEYSSNKIGDWTDLFEQIKKDASKDINYNYPLAFMYFYGVGTKQDEGEAVDRMNELASVKGDTRAKAWLSNYFYDKAYSDDSKNIFFRRKYVKSAQYWSNQMHNLKMKEWYGVKGDMCISDQDRELSTKMQDSALYYYKLGDEAGDIYSTYRLGSMYLQSQKNLQEAEKLLMKAANQGNEGAILELGRLALQRKDFDAYLYNLHLAADMGCPEAYEEIGDAYSAGASHGFKLDPREGIKMKKYALRAEQDDWIPVILSFGYNIDPYLNK